MDIDIRKHVISNFKDISEDEIRETIEESLEDTDDLVLPGFGVFFELLWKNSDIEQKEMILHTIENAINNK